MGKTVEVQVLPAASLRGGAGGGGKAPAARLADGASCVQGG